MPRDALPHEPCASCPSCDHPQCDCDYECERQDKHEDFVRDQENTNAAR